MSRKSDVETRNTRTFVAFIWHAFFLALTMSMIEFSTVLPSLTAELTDSKVAYGFIYSILYGSPVVFSLVFSRFLQGRRYTRGFLLFGIYLRGASFLGMSASVLLLSQVNPKWALLALYFLVFIFSLSGGFSGIAYADIVGKILTSKERGRLYALKQVFSGLGSLLGGVLIAKILKPGDLSFPLNYSLSLLIGGVGLILGAFGFWMIREPPSRYTPATAVKQSGYLRSALRVLSDDRCFLRFVLVENLTSFSLMLLPFYMAFAVVSFQNYRSYLGFYVIAKIAGTIGSNALWARISSKKGSWDVVGACILMGAITPAAAIILMPLGPFWYGITFLLIGFISSGRAVGFEASLLDLAPEDERVMYLGVRGTTNILVAVLPVMGGLLIQSLGFVPVFAAVCIIMMGAFVISISKHFCAPAEKSL